MTSNRLPILASEIRQAHADVQEAAKTAAERAIDAGHRLIEAKSLVGHGEWLPWLREHCALAERTAQLYMKIATSGVTPAIVADIGLNAAAKVIATFVDDKYDPFFHCDKADQKEWLVFILFLAREFNGYVESTSGHVEYLLQKQFKAPSEWLGAEGATWRKRCGMREPSDYLKQRWPTFLAQYRDRGQADIVAEIEGQEKSEPRRPVRKRRRRAA